MRQRGRGERRYRPQSQLQPADDTEAKKQTHLATSESALKPPAPASKRRRRSRFSSVKAVYNSPKPHVAEEKKPEDTILPSSHKDDEFAPPQVIVVKKRRRALQERDDDGGSARENDVFGGFDEDETDYAEKKNMSSRMVRGIVHAVFGENENEVTTTAKDSGMCLSANNHAEVDPLESFMLGVEQRAKEEVYLPARTTSANSVIGSDDEAYDEVQKVRVESPEGNKGFLEKVRKKRLVYEKVDHSTLVYTPFKRNLYIEVPELTRMTHDDVAAIRKTMGGIRIRGKRCPKPVLAFSQCGLPTAILDIIKALEFAGPTPIQAQGIPAVMSGRDVIGIAKTGSGKTLAYLLPALRHAAIQPRVLPGEGAIVMIIAPTRELALQIYGESKRFGKAIGLRSVCVYGGSSIASQISDLKRGTEIVVCTPGRMIDLLAMNNGRVTNLRRCTFIVLDEADRMFDLGFAPQLTRLVENVRPDRQTALFSATFPPAVESLARKILQQPVEITVGGNSAPASSIRQYVEVRTEASKFFRLLALLGEYYSKGSTLVFVDRQENADKIYISLQKAGYKCLPLHGGIDQSDRDSAIADFKASLVKVLVATSVAARGLDVRDLNLVVNYDVPNHYEDYVHRIGRTGRAGRSGTAYTFITPEQGMFAAKLLKALEISNQLATQRHQGSSKDENINIIEVPDDLRKLAEEFEEKRRRGEVKHGASSGYGGKGFKFTADEEKKSSAIRKLQAKEYAANTGEVDDDTVRLEGSDDETVPGDEEDEEVVVREISREPKATQTGSGVKHGLDIAVPRRALSAEEIKTLMRDSVEKEEAAAVAEGVDDAEKARRVALAKGRVLSLAAARSKAAAQRTAREAMPTSLPTSLPLADSGAASGTAASAAAKAAAAISAKLGVEAKTTTGGGNGLRDTNEDADDLEKRKFATELEINDYPQHARWRVTHKNSLADVEEFTGCAFTTKGNHYPTGRNPPPGERKLYLLIEGPDVASVKTARHEVKRKLEEAAAARPDDRETYSKYLVI